MKRKHFDAYKSVLESCPKNRKTEGGTTEPDFKSFGPPLPMSENFKTC